MAEQVAVVVTAEHEALAQRLYGQGELDTDGLAIAAEMVAEYQAAVGRLPATVEELDGFAEGTPCGECSGKGGTDGKQCEGCGAASTEPEAVVPTVVVDEVAVQGLLKAFGKQCRRAADASLEMGRLASEYVTARMLLSDKVTRDACTKTLVSVWQESADEVVTVQRVGALIRLYQTSVAFPAVDGCKKPSLRQYRAFSVLVVRADKQRAETWAVDQDMAADATALWTEAATKGLSGEECEGAVAALVQRAAEAKVQAKKDQAVAEHKAALLAQQAVVEEGQRTAAAENAAKLAQQAAAAPAADADKAALTAAADKAKAALLAQQAAEAAKRQEAELLAQQLARTQAEQRVAAAQQAAEAAKAAAKADKAAKKATDAGPGATPPPAPVNQGANLLSVAAKGTVKDVAEMAAKLVTGSTAPDDVLLELLKTLALSPELSKLGHRAANAAIAVYTAPTVTVTLPTAVAERNGSLAVAS
jgi:hypothetical protein